MDDTTDSVKINLVQKKIGVTFMLGAIFYGALLGVFVTGVYRVYAAQLTSVSDKMSNPTASASSTHTIVFTTPSGIGFASTTIIRFNGFANLGQVGSTSIDILVGNSTSTAVQQTVQNVNGASQWGVATATNALTITSPSSGTVPTPGQVVMVKIGTNATSGTQGTQNITNPAAGSYIIGINGTMWDAGSTTINIVSNAVVSVSATVAQSISFAILSATSTAFNNNINYGALSSAAVKFASSTNASGSNSTTTAHVLTISTNAPTGYTITLQGDTLRNQNATSTFIAAIGATASTSNAGTPQFGINVTSSGGTGTSTNPTYGTTNRYGYNASTSTADTLSSGTLPTTTTTYSLFYMANIPATQAAGAYTTSITYVGTANF
jgi:hypothetical protein